MPINLYEDFDNPTGEFVNYDVYDAGQRVQLRDQQHIDIRTFASKVTSSYSMGSLDVLSGTELDPNSQQALETANVLNPGENWTSGTVGPQSDRNNFSGLSLSCGIGVTSTSSVIQTTAGLRAIDLSALDDGGRISLPLLFTSGSDYISLALPAFPASSLNLASSFVDFTSESSGNFATGPTVSVPLSESLTTLTTGDCEAQIALGRLGSIDRARITGVRFRITATVSCTFRCIGIRAMGRSWTYAPVDQNTLYHRVQATIPPTASVSQPYTFPSAISPPSDWPILWRSDPLTSDPTPVNMEIGARIHTGAGAEVNTFTLYFRETPTVPDLQTDLDGRTMAQLEAIGVQPDAAPPAADYTPDTMSDLDALRIATLDSDTMRVLETSHRASDTRYIYVAVQWGSAGSVTISNQSGDVSYTFPNVGIGAQSDYYLFVKLEDNSIRVQVLPLTPEGYIQWGLPVFDSTKITDQALLVRRRGRFGWYAHLRGGDTYVTALRDRYTVYNEYLSLPFNSETPVEGAQLYAGAAPDTDLYPGAVPNASGTKISLDLTKSDSGDCLRVDCDGTVGQQGLVTPAMRFTNFAESRIEFDALIPAGVELLAQLNGEFRHATLNIPPLATNQWQHVTISLDSIGALYQPGPYQFSLTQKTPGETTWYIDNLMVPSHAIVWAGRQAADPWKMCDPQWTPFGATVNRPTDGILFDRGTRMQIRGRGVTQDATIQHLQIIPRYAQLGNFVWADQAPTSLGAPSPSFTVSRVGLTATYTSTSTAANGIAACLWNLGDGTVLYGTQVVHTYTGPGAYTVSLTVIDRLNFRATVLQTVTVTAGILTLPLPFTK